MMVKAKLLNWKKETVGELELPESIFMQEVSLHNIHEIIRWQRASRRQGTHKAKTRGEVRGGGKKPFRQKGTGNARQGSIRSPLNEAGGVTFGPRPRKYNYSLPKKVKASGLKQALSHLWKEKRIFVVEDMKSEEGKTKELSERLKLFGLGKALLVDQEAEFLFQRACKNLRSFQFLPVKALNAFDLLRYGHLVMSQRGVLALTKRFAEGIKR